MNKEQFWNELKSGAFSSMVRESSKGMRLLSPEGVYHVMKPIFAERDDIERLYCIFMNARNRIIAIENMSDGTVDHAVIYPREIIKRTIALNATSVIMVHNHLSGDTTPSRDDKKITVKIGVSLLSIGAHLHDHIIVGDDYHSMADSGIIGEIRPRMRELIS